MPQGKLETVGRVANRRGTKVRFKPDPQIFGARARISSRAACSTWRARRPTCSAASRSAGTARPRCSRARRRSGGGDVPLPGRPEGLSGARHRGQGRWSSDQIFSGKITKPGGARLARMGGRLDGRRRRLLSLLLQHHPDARRRHARGRPAHRAAARPADHAERVGQTKRAAASPPTTSWRPAPRMLSVFIREPEFHGQTKDRWRPSRPRRIVESAIRDAFDHWLAASPPQANKLLDWVDRARRRAAAPPPGKGGRPQDRDPQAAPARQARRLHQRGARTAPNSSSSRAIRPAARPSRRATARPRRSCRFAARSSTSPRPAATSSRQNQQLSDLVQALGCGTGARYRDDDLRYEQGHHHDRRRRRRRPHRLAAHHLLLPPDAAAHRRGPPLPRGAAALPPDARRRRPSMPATTRTATS